VGVFGLKVPQNDSYSLQSLLSGFTSFQNGAAFTEEEQVQLRTMLQLTAVELDTVVESCAYIFEQAAYQSCSTDVLGKHLQVAGMENAQIQATIKVWQVEAANLLSKLRKRTLGGPKVLAGSSWTMNLQMGQSGLTRLTEPTAIFEMVLSDPPSTSDVSRKSNSICAASTRTHP
jgi:hypothetical protein